MSFNTNAQAILWMPNTRGSVNALLSAYYTLKKEVALWTQLVMGNSIPNDANIVEDGNLLIPAVDATIQSHITDATNFIAFMEANSSAVLNRCLQLGTSYNSQI